MVWITKTPSGLLVQRDAAAIPLALGPIIHELIDAGRSLGEARRQGYEAGLTEGYQKCERERAMLDRIRERSAADAAELLATLDVTTIAARAA